MAGNETIQTGWVEVTWKNLVYMEMTGNRNDENASQAPSGSSGAIAHAGGNQAAGNEPSAPPESSFGGETNIVPSEEQSRTTTEGAGMPFQGVSVQTGTSFTSGNQTTSLPISTSNVLWGAAAAALLGSTLAEWQKKREEEAARLAASSGGDGGSDEEGMPEDVRARRRGKVIAKNKAKRAQESRWEQARVTQNAKPAVSEESFMQKTYQKILNAANVIPGMSAWRGEQEEQERQENDDNRANDIYAARWAGVASVWQGKQEEEKSGGKSLAMPARNYEPPLWEKIKQTWEDAKTWTNDNVIQPAKQWAENKIEQTWPALRATGPGEDGIYLVDKYRDVIVGTVSSFNSFIKAYGSIPYTYEYTNRKGKTIQEQQDHSVSINPTSLAISLSVQAEAPGFVDFLQWIFSPIFDSPSFGMAQVNQSDYKLLRENIEPYTNLHGISPIPYFALKNTQLSTAAMIERVMPGVEVCREYGCKPTDQEIIIGVNQNGDGGFSENDLRTYFEKEYYHADSSPTLVDWQKVFNERTIKDGGVYDDFLNWRASGHNFDTWFMLKRYYNNAMTFEESGEWSMPQGVDWEYIKSLIEDTPPSSQWK